MRFKGLDLNLLVALNILLEEKSVSKAARRLFRSPSAMSGALANLREYFRDELLTPSGRRLVLTPFGEGLVAPIQQLMAQIDRTLDISPSFDPATSLRRFKICVTEQDADLVMPAVVRRAFEVAPGVRLDMIAASPSAGAMIESHRADLILVAESSVSPLFAAELAYEDDYVLLASADHEPPSTPEAFLARGRVACWFGQGEAFSYAESQLQRLGGGSHIEVIAPSLRAVPDFLAGTPRIALVNRALAQVWAQRFGFVPVPVPLPLKPLRIMFQSHSARSDDAGILWLKELIGEQLALTYRSVPPNA